VNKADHAEHKRDYAKASQLHAEASERFMEAKDLTKSTEAQRALNTLAEQHLERSKFLIEMEKERQKHPERNHDRPVPELPPGSMRQHDDLTASLATARGIRHTVVSQAKKEDPINKLYTSATVAYTKAFKTAVEKLNKDKSFSGSSGIRSDNESFYLVPTPAPTKSSSEELATEVTSLRNTVKRFNAQIQAHELGLKKLKDSLKTNLGQLRDDIDARETTLVRQYEAELEALRTENNNLKIQNGRFKSRWDQLKESARKRREGSAEDDD
jgi:hypothetical protein